LKQPIYVPPNFNISPGNQFAGQQVVKLFLCPSDRMQPVATGSTGDYRVPTVGPINYAVCVGTGTTNGGAPFGSPLNADGMFTSGTDFRMTDTTDGSSHTAMMCESLLGASQTNASGPMPSSPQAIQRICAALCGAAARCTASRRDG
jgi:hypothetical protein